MRKIHIYFLIFTTVFFSTSNLIACGTELTTTSSTEATTLMTTSTATTTPQTMSPTQTTISLDYSKWTITTTLDKRFIISIGASDDAHTWVPFFDNTAFEQIGDSIENGSHQAEVNPFNAHGSEHFTFHALKTGKTQIMMVYRPITDEGSLDPEEMTFWQELFTIIIE